MKKLHTFFAFGIALVLFSSSTCNDSQNTVQSPCEASYVFDASTDNSWVVEKITNDVNLAMVYKTKTIFGEVFYVFGYAEFNSPNTTYQVFNCDGSQEYNGEVIRLIDNEETPASSFVFRHSLTGALFYYQTVIWAN